MAAEVAPPDLDGTVDPLESLPPQRSPRGLGLFFQSQTEEPSEPTPPAGEPSDLPPLPDDASPSASDWPPAEDDPLTDGQTSSPASSPDPASRKPLSNKALK